MILGSASNSPDVVNEPDCNRAIFFLNLSLIWSAAATVNVRSTTSAGSKPSQSCKFILWEEGEIRVPPSNSLGRSGVGRRRVAR